MDVKTFAPAGFLMTHRLGQHALQGDFGGTAVILSDPPRQLEDAGRNQCLCADDFQNRFERGVG